MTVVYVLCLLPGQSPELKSNLALDANDVRLSASIRVTFTVEGEAPLRVTVPNSLLTEESAAVWKVRGVEPAVVETLTGGRQRWTLLARVDPYVRGEKLKLAFTPAEVVAGTDPTVRTVSWPVQEVRVWTVASRTDEVQVTGIEPTPPTSRVPTDWTGPAVAVAVLAVAAAALGVVAYRRRTYPPPSAYDLADRKLRAAGDHPAMTVADAIRGFVEATFGIPASRLTTDELKSHTSALTAEMSDSLMSILERCDAAKFAGNPTDGPILVEDARRFLALTRPVKPG